MSNVGTLGKKLLYIAVIVAFATTALSSLMVTDMETGEIFLQFSEQTYPIKENLAQSISIVSKLLSTTVLLILIQLYNATKKSNAITQGSLDAKQNQSLLNNVESMVAQKWILKSIHTGDSSERDIIVANLDKNIATSIELAKQTIDSTAAPIQTQIDNKQAFIGTLEMLVGQAKVLGDSALVTSLTNVISVTLTEITSLSKKLS